MSIAFRTDASLQIGAGHVMRCLTLADALRSDGAQCYFICRAPPGNLIEEIRQRGFSVSVLPNATEAVIGNDLTVDRQSKYAAWLDADWGTDAQQTKVSIGATAVDWLVVDHYALDARWEQTLRPLCRRLMVIDDLADRSHDCDLLLDQNLGRDMGDYSSLVPEACTVLVGPSYAMLRPEFAALRDESLRCRATPRLKHLLIAMGGVDQANATGKVLECLKNCQLPAELRITVVMGTHAPWLKGVQLLAKQLRQPTVIKVNVNNMAEIMAESDLAIGAAGSSSWERCCLGLPTLVLALADNQKEASVHLERIGAAYCLQLDDELQQQIQYLLQRLFRKSEQLREMSVCASAIVNGKGVERVVGAMRSNL